MAFKIWFVWVLEFEFDRSSRLSPTQTSCWIWCFSVISRPLFLLSWSWNWWGSRFWGIIINVSLSSAQVIRLEFTKFFKLFNLFQSFIFFDKNQILIQSADQFSSHFLIKFWCKFMSNPLLVKVTMKWCFKSKTIEYPKLIPKC